MAQKKSQQAQHPPVKSVLKQQSTQAGVKPPEEWTQKLNSDEFLKQWYSTAKTSQLVQDGPPQAVPSLSLPADAVFPPDAEEMGIKTSVTPSKAPSAKTAMLSKFLTSSAQPKVESA